jgi:hypothetical protein
MKFRQTILSLIALSMVAALVGCSSSSSKPVVQPISVAFSGTPPTSIAETASQSFTAAVTNDTASAGVTWACAPAGACGTFSATSTASGAPTTYTAPATIPSGGTATVTATSVTDATKSASATVTITSASSLADGTYVFLLAGQNSAAQYIYYVGGAFTVAGGTVTAGEQDFIDYFNATSLTDSISGGSVTIAADGNLQISLTTCLATDCTQTDTAVGVAGVETLNGTLVSGVRALINEFDASATSSGELDLQTSTSAGQGGYAFLVNGGDASGCPSSIGGVVNSDGPGTISGTGSVFDINDACNGILLTNQPIDPSTVSAPDAFGRIEISLDMTTSGIGGIGLAGYIVDGNRIRLVENSLDPNDVFFGVTGGTAFAQGASTGTFANTTIEGSSFVFSTNGQDVNGYLQLAGVLTTNVDGTTVSGTLNFNDLTGIGPQAPIAFTGTYTVDATGRVTLSSLTDGATFTYNAQLYLDGNGHAAFATMDNTDTAGGYAFPQTGGGSFTAASFAGNYGFDATGIDFNTFEELDAVGPVTADGVSALNGTVDLNLLLGAQTSAVPLTDGFSTVDPSGFLTGTVTGLDTSFGSTDAFSYYLVDTTKAVAIQSDPNQLTLGYFELQQ